MVWITFHDQLYQKNSIDLDNPYKKKNVKLPIKLKGLVSCSQEIYTENSFGFENYCQDTFGIKVQETIKDNTLADLL